MLVLAVAAISLSSTKADAAVFYASGIFEDGSVLSGTLTIDTIAGLITDSNLVVGPPSAFTFTVIVNQGDLPAPFFYSVRVRNAGATEDFSFGLLTHSLVGYTGGEICSLATPTCSYSNLLNTGTNLAEPALSSGSLSDVPEPATVALVGTAVALLRLRRRRTVA